MAALPLPGPTRIGRGLSGRPLSGIVVAEGAGTEALERGLAVELNPDGAPAALLRVGGVVWLLVKVPFTDGVDGVYVLVEEAGAGRTEAAPPIRLPRSVLSPLSSVFRSLSRLSVVSLCDSIALGMRSFRLRTSSLIRRASSSRLRPAALSSLMTDSTSCRALSRFSVRVCSEALRAAVSVLSWSRSAKAFSNDASIAALSCSSCGGVGGATRG